MHLLTGRQLYVEPMSRCDSKGENRIARLRIERLFTTRKYYSYIG